MCCKYCCHCFQRDGESTNVQDKDYNPTYVQDKYDKPTYFQDNFYKMEIVENNFFGFLMVNLDTLSLKEVLPYLPSSNGRTIYMVRNIILTPFQ
jgi:hypothetical protein